MLFRSYKDNETGENVCLTDRILGIEKGERIDKKVKAELIQGKYIIYYQKD